MGKSVYPLRAYHGIRSNVYLGQIIVALTDFTSLDSASRLQISITTDQFHCGGCYVISTAIVAVWFLYGSAGIRVSVLVSIAPCHRAREISLVSSDFKGTGL